MRTAETMLDVMRGWIGYSEINGKHKIIVDTYNNYSPLPYGYKVKYSDDWCDTTISAAAIKANMVDLIGVECGCERHIKIFKHLGIWNEDGTIIPNVGDLILYNWGNQIQPNDGFADHIGIVEEVNNGIITTIEGNKGNAVSRCFIPVGYKYIRGFAQPKYERGENMNKAEAKAIVKEKAGLSDDTIHYIADMYIYGEALILKLAQAMK